MYFKLPLVLTCTLKGNETLSHLQQSLTSKPVMSRAALSRAQGWCHLHYGPGGGWWRWRCATAGGLPPVCPRRSTRHSSAASTRFATVVCHVLAYENHVSDGSGAQQRSHMQSVAVSFALALLATAHNGQHAWVSGCPCGCCAGLAFLRKG